MVGQERDRTHPGRSGTVLIFTRPPGRASVRSSGAAQPAVGEGDRAVGPSAPRDPEDVLELRIHGVNNTPPHHVLDVPRDAVRQVSGDPLGGFWRVDPAWRPGPAGSTGQAPPGVLREAYSWGGLARTSLTARGLASAVIGLVARPAWALLMPYGLVNVAFWSRRLEPGGEDHRWQRGRQAAALRLFGFLLTLLMLASASVVSLDLVATQCFSDGQVRCSGLPGAVRRLAEWDAGNRLALGSLVPLAVLGLLVLLGSVTRTRYEQRTTPSVAGRGAVAALATRRFWANARLTSTVGRAHLAGGLCFMVVATAWHQVFATGRACARPSQVLGSGLGACVAQVVPLPPSAWPFAATLVLALLGLLLTGVQLLSRSWGRVAPTGSTSLDHRTTWLVGVSALLFVVHLALLVRTEHVTDPDVPLLGLVVTPWLLTAGLLLLAVLATRWRGAGRGHRGAGGTRGAHRLEAWGGRAPAVFLVLALGLGLALSSLVVVGAGDWLNGGRPARDLLRRAVAAPPGTLPAERGLAIPTVYVWFGAATFLALLGTLVVAVWIMRRTGGVIPPAEGTPEQPSPPTAETLARARRRAAVAHRAEPAVLVLAVATLAGLGGALLFSVVLAVWPGLAPPQLRPGSTAGGWSSFYGWLVDAAVWGVAFIGLAVLVGLVAGAVLGRARPLGLVWDLICFLPRAGHPFGPPCYAERAVPELLHRCEAWLRTGPHRRVVLSAHSLGGVLAVATVLAARERLPGDHVDRISLLTYGTQLRPYFGRMFPELLGPEALGTAPAPGARLLTTDPWVDVVAQDVAALGAVPVPAPGRTVLGILEGESGPPRWVSLWRRTDHLGFPVDRFVGSVVDRPAEEVEPGTKPKVGAHGGYPRTAAYRRAFDDLIGTPASSRTGDEPSSGEVGPLPGGAPSSSNEVPPGPQG